MSGSVIASEIRNGISLIIPTWNNLPYLKKCVMSIKEHSKYPHQIIVFINEGSDGTREFINEMWWGGMKISFLSANKNVGVCKAVNEARGMAQRNMIGFVNDDMVMLPKWDERLAFFAMKYDIPKLSWLSCTPIEPRGTNPCCLVTNKYGQRIEVFQEKSLLNALPKMRNKMPNKVSTWAPSFWHIDVFDEVGGFSEEFSPGRGHDPDFAKKLYDIGCRTFVGVGNSLVYHFMCKTIHRVKQKNSKALFAKKHGISMKQFTDKVLKRGTDWKVV